MTIFFIFFYILLAGLAVFSRILRIRCAAPAKLLPLSFLIIYILIAGFRANLSGGTIWILFCGALVCGLAGDFFLLNKGRWLRQGIVAFLAGHVLYSIAFFSIGSRPPWYILGLFALYALTYLTILLRLLIPRHRKYLLLALAYFAAIMTMLAAALFADTRFMAQGSKSCFFAAALLFSISDGILAYRIFSRYTRLADGLVLASYYLAQGLMLLGLLLTTG